ncbi:MAG: exopolysaccharide biosynthesis protein [Brevundimonas sp.]|uniref:exopolysaccharide biosynthesis protein n=1 Tax=Brevundimonas sp. TaxID=1871086 RepID=UPI0025BD6262|nr:exopolysaccharide biosynthesis protein [Brevundimonas sp.]MBX3476226.1 exopolysaccharide biosynthesis protein [Brevundimonas sp.]
MPDYDYEADARPFSRLLSDIGARDEPKLYLGELINAFGERGFGAMMVFLGLLNALASPIPGSTTVLGAPLLLICLQVLFLRDQLWMPRWALKSSLPRAEFRRVTGKVDPLLRRIERISRPRWLVMTTPAAQVLIGLAASLLSLIVMLPIFGGNLFPSLFVALFGFGLMQRDGAAVVAAWLGAAGFAAFVWAAWEVISRVFLATVGWWGHLFG